MNTSAAITNIGTSLRWEGKKVNNPFKNTKELRELKVQLEESTKNIEAILKLLAMLLSKQINKLGSEDLKKVNKFLEEIQ